MGLGSNKSNKRMIIRDEEDALFLKWKKQYSDESFVFNGLVSEKDYLESCRPPQKLDRLKVEFWV